MSTNLKVRLFKGKTHADGSHPIQLQFYIDGRLKRKGIYSCLEDDWDFKTNRVKSKVKNASYINNLISEKFAEHERTLIKILNGDNAPKDFFKPKKIITLDAMMESECERFKNENKPGSYDLTVVYRKELASFCDSKYINITTIDLEWFKSYANYIYSEITIKGKVVKKANVGSSVQKKIKTIRRMVERYSGKLFDVETKDYRQKVNKPVKQKLTHAEVIRIEQLKLKTGSRLDCARDVFLMQIYLRGARIGSLIQAHEDQFKDGRYVPLNGAGKNNSGSKLIPKAQLIVDKYAGKHQRLFPFFEYTPDQNASDFDNARAAHFIKKNKTSLINGALKEIAPMAGITKPLSSHIARHTFARMAIDKINNPMVTMELLGHSSLAVHQAYLNDIRKDDVLDAAADDIFG